MKRTRLLLLVVPLVAGVFYLRSLASWRPKIVFKERGRVTNLVFSDDGKRLLVVHQNQSTSSSILATLDSGNKFVPLWRHPNSLGTIKSPQFLAKDSQVLVQGEGSDTKFLDTQTGKTLRNCGLLQPAVVSPDGQWFAYYQLPSISPFYGKNSLSPTANYRNFAIAKRLTISGAFAFSPDGNTFVAGRGDRRCAHLDFYDVKTGKRLRTGSDLQSQFYTPYHTTLQWSRNGNFLFASGIIPRPHGWLARTRFASLWRAGDGHKLASTVLQGSSPFPPTSSWLPDFFEVQNDGRVLSFSGNGRVFLSKSASLDLKFEQLLFLAKETITAATMSPDASYLVAGTQSGRVYYQRVK